MIKDRIEREQYMVKEPKVILLVGHINWGKSRTLEALTNNRRRTFEVNGCEIFIRRMSNDDPPEDGHRRLLRFVNTLDSQSRPYVIIAFCPNKEDVDILDVLRQQYQLYFWVLKYQYGGNGEITQGEIEWMRKFGIVEVFNVRAEAHNRAESLRQFLDRILP